MLMRCALFISVLITALLLLNVRAQDEPITVGDEVTVIGEALVLMIYSEPDTMSPIVEATVSGITLTVIGGPEDDGETIWWQVRSLSGSEGWIQYLINGEASIGIPSRSQDSIDPDEELTIGELATVVIDTYVLMYEEPDASSAPMEALVSGVQVMLLDGPEDVDDQRWWYVESPSGNEGWLQETLDGNQILNSLRAMLLRTVTPTPSPTPFRTVTPVPTLTPIVCPGSLPAMFTVGDYVRISPGPPNNLRSGPTLNSRIVGQLQASTELEIVGGPVCADGYTWWQVRRLRQEGWTAQGDHNEYWLESLD
jgi:hypothetical protein